MRGARALCLAWGAVVALLAYPAGAQVIGQEGGILGGEAGFLRPSGAPEALTIDAMPYARTVTCSDYTLTGTTTGAVTDASSASVSLLLHAGGTDGSSTFTDSSDTPKTMTPVGNAQIDNAQRKYGSGAYLGDGTGDYLTTPDSTAFTLGSGDFTIETWVRFTNTAGFPSFVDQADATGLADASFFLGYNTAEGFKAAFSADGTTFTSLTSLATASTGQWYHVATTRSGNTVRLFVDGVQVDSDTFSGSMWDSSSVVTIGTAHTGCGSCSLDGHLDDVRITKGVARYTGAFSVPSEDFPPQEVYWAASPSSTVGPCTGTASFSCVVDVAPDAVGEGVETITVARGSVSDTETIGFYVDGEHSCFLSQSVNGTYNSGLSDLDAVATWENLGSSALDVTQGTGSAQPTFRTSIVGGQPVVRCDGGDFLRASTAADWSFFTDSADWSASIVYNATQANPTTLQLLMASQAVLGSNGTGFSAAHEDRAAASRNNAVRSSGGNGLGVVLWLSLSSSDVAPTEKFNDLSVIHDDDGGAGADFFDYSNNSLTDSEVVGGAYVSSSPPRGFTICSSANNPADLFLTGDVFAVRVYQSALSSTQRGINEAVDEWALGASFPVTP